MSISLAQRQGVRGWLLTSCALPCSSAVAAPSKTRKATKGLTISALPFIITVVLYYTLAMSGKGRAW